MALSKGLSMACTGGEQPAPQAEDWAGEHGEAQGPCSACGSTEAMSVSLERGSLLMKTEQKSYWGLSNLGQRGSLEHESKDS